VGQERLANFTPFSTVTAIGPQTKAPSTKLDTSLLALSSLVLRNTPLGHRHSDNLQRATLVLFDIDNAPNLTRAELEARLRSLGVGFIFYSTWSNARVDSGKTGLCARIVFWLTRPLTAPDGLPQNLRVQSIGQQLAAIVRHLSTRLEIDSTKAVDEVSKRPHQLMYTPRGHDVGRSSPDCWWCKLHDGPSLNPDALPGGVSLAELLTLSAPQLTNTNELPPTPTPPPPPSTSSKATPQTRRCTDAVLRARGLAYIQKCAKNLNTLSEGRYTRIKTIGPQCGSVAAGHGLTEVEGLEPLETVVNAWRRDDLIRALNATFAHGYQDPHTLPNNYSTLTRPNDKKPNTDAVHTAKELKETLDTHTQTPTPASRSPNPQQWAIKGCTELGYYITTEKVTFDTILQRPPTQRHHCALILSPSQIPMLRQRIQPGSPVFVEICTTHPLYPQILSLIITPFNAKWRSPLKATPQ
jgi:hypothetical protein